MLSAAYELGHISMFYKSFVLIFLLPFPIGQCLLPCVVWVYDCLSMCMRVSVCMSMPVCVHVCICVSHIFFSFSLTFGFAMTIQDWEVLVELQRSPCLCVSGNGIAVMSYHVPLVPVIFTLLCKDKCSFLYLRWKVGLFSAFNPLFCLEVIDNFLPQNVYSEGHWAACLHPWSGLTHLLPGRVLPSSYHVRRVWRLDQRLWGSRSTETQIPTKATWTLRTYPPPHYRMPLSPWHINHWIFLFSGPDNCSKFALSTSVKLYLPCS